MERHIKGRIGLGVLVVVAYLGVEVMSRREQEAQFLARIEEARETPIAVGIREIYWPPRYNLEFLPRGLVYKGILGDKFAVASGRSLDFYPLNTEEFDVKGHRYGLIEATEDTLRLKYLGLVDE